MPSLLTYDDEQDTPLDGSTGMLQSWELTDERAYRAEQRGEPAPRRWRGRGWGTPAMQAEHKARLQALADYQNSLLP